MKKILLAICVICGSLLALPAWAHHAAEGIISDEIWQMINEQLNEADSPHVDMTFITVDQFIDVDTVMSDFNIIDTGGGSMVETSIMVPESDVEAVTGLLEEAIAEVELAADNWGDAPTGSAGDNEQTPAITYTVGDPDVNGNVLITLSEPIGSGEIQEVTQPRNGN